MLRGMIACALVALANAQSDASNGELDHGELVKRPPRGDHHEEHDEEHDQRKALMIKVSAWYCADTQRSERLHVVCSTLNDRDDNNDHHADDEATMLEAYGSTMLSAWCEPGAPGLKSHPEVCTRHAEAKVAKEEAERKHRILKSQTDVMVEWWCNNKTQRWEMLPCIKHQKARATDSQERKRLLAKWQETRKAFLDQRSKKANSPHWHHTMAVEWCRGGMEGQNGSSELCMEFEHDAEKGLKIEL